MSNSTLEPKLMLETVQWTTLKQIEDLRPINDDDYAVLGGSSVRCCYGTGIKIALGCVSFTSILT